MEPLFPLYNADMTEQGKIIFHVDDHVMYRNHEKNVGYLLDFQQGPVKGPLSLRKLCQNHAICPKF